MKKILLLSFIFLSFLCPAAPTVRIDFYPYASDDFDVFFRKGFESAGYQAFVNYFDRSADKPYDLLFTYEWKDNVLKGHLTDRSGALIGSGEEKFTHHDRMESMTYQFLGELLDRRINVGDRRGRIRLGFGLAGFEMVKLDSAIYALTVLGNETMSMNAVEKVFFNAGMQLTGTFRTYYIGSYHQYETASKWLPSSQLIGWKVQGVVIASEIQGKNYTMLAEPPGVYLQYLEYLTKGLEIPEGNTVGNNLSRILVLRNSNKSADYGPYIVYLDGREVCNLRYKKYASLEVPPGTHIISVRAPNAFSTSNEVRLPVKVEVNKTAYVSVIWSFHVGIMYQEIKEFEAKLMIRGLIREECH